MSTGSYLDDGFRRILFDTAAKILSAAAEQGAFYLYRIVHWHKILQSGDCALYLPAIINPRQGVRGDIIRRELLSRSQLRRNLALAGETTPATQPVTSGTVPLIDRAPAL